MLRGIRKLSLLSFLLFSLSCVNNISEHGYQFGADDLEKIKLKQSKIIVKELLGPPTLELNNNDFDHYYYIKYAISKKAFHKSKIARQKIVKITFSENRVSKIEEFSDKMQNNLAFSLDKTKGEKIKQNIFLQILNNFGKFGGQDEF